MCSAAVSQRYKLCIFICKLSVALSVVSVLPRHSVVCHLSIEILEASSELIARSGQALTPRH